MKDLSLNELKKERAKAKSKEQTLLKNISLWSQKLFESKNELENVRDELEILDRKLEEICINMNECILRIQKEMRSTYVSKKENTCFVDSDYKNKAYIQLVVFESDGTGKGDWAALTNYSFMIPCGEDMINCAADLIKSYNIKKVYIKGNIRVNIGEIKKRVGQIEVIREKE